MVVLVMLKAAMLVYSGKVYRGVVKEEGESKVGEKEEEVIISCRGPFHRSPNSGFKVSSWYLLSKICEKITQLLIVERSA